MLVGLTLDKFLLDLILKRIIFDYGSKSYMEISRFSHAFFKWSIDSHLNRSLFSFCLGLALRVYQFTSSTKALSSQLLAILKIDEPISNLNRSSIAWVCIKIDFVKNLACPSLVWNTLQERILAACDV